MSRKVNQAVVDTLQAIYIGEVGAVGIYMDQHVKCEDKGYDKFADTLKGDAVEEMKHAESLMARILFIGGTVKNQKHDLPDENGMEVIDMIKRDIAIEEIAIKKLNDGIRTCFEEGDNGSRLLLEGILKDEEKHLDKYEMKRDNIEKYGDSWVVTHLM